MVFPEGVTPSGAGIAGIATDEGLREAAVPDEVMQKRRNGETSGEAGFEGEVPKEPESGDRASKGRALYRSGLRTADSAEGASSGVTFEKTGDYTYNIYANGQPLLIEVSSSNQYSELYIDDNGNGVGDQGEEIIEFRGDSEVGIYYSDGLGYFLTNSSIYGGGKDGVYTYDTNVTLTGPSDLKNRAVMAVYGGNANGTLTGSTRVNIKNAIVYQVFGGNADGTLTGSTCVNIEAGNVYQVFGGNAGGVLEGDTCVNISGISADDVYGGNANGTLTGSTCVNMEAGNVWQIFGGNAEGTLDGDARVNISGGNATYVYGGGNHAEISGNTLIYITGGCADNIYGGSSTGQVNGNSLVDVKNAKIGTVFGGNKVSGKVTGDTNLVFGENTQATGWIYGGGEGSDGNAIVEVTGSTNIIVNDGTFTQIFGGGRKHATVGNSNITVNAGNISSYIYGGGEEKSSVTGKASITVNGGSLYGVCASGASGAGTTVEDAEIFLKNVEIKYFNCDSPVEGKLSVSFENASASTFLLAEKAFNTAGATLSFIDCGSAEKGWTEQPEVGFRPNQNKFHTILIQNSYIRFQDNSTENGSVINDCTLDGCTENLILDGGALWVKEGMRFNMPVTEFRNEPLILRTGGMAIHFDEVPNGTARIQWMNEDGTVPDNPSGQALVEAPTDTPDKTFVSGDARYGLKTDSIAQDNGIWRGKAWYVIDLATTCNCTLLSALLQEYVFPLSIDGEQTVVTLKDVYEGSTAYSANCPVIGHDGTAVTAEYSLIAEGTTAKGASINGNQLTVEGMGSVHIMVRQQLNGKSREDDCYVQIMEFPESDNYTFTVGMIEEISFAFGEINAAGILNNAVLWSDTDNKYVDSANYSVTEEDNRVRFVINKNYLEGLSLGKYGFRASIPYRDGEGKMSGYMYCFTVNIVPVIVVDDPVIELLEEPLHYDGKEKKPAVVVKYGDTVIPEEEYTVSYENNIDVSQDSKPAKVIIMDVEGGRYQVNGTREFEIINEYTAKAGTDYELPELNEYGWTNKEFVISAAEDHLLSTGNTLDGEWTEQLPPYTEETGDGSVTFYVKDTETGLISLAVTEKYKLDQTAPEITDILFDGKSVKTELDENIPFSSLFGKDVKVEITAEDKLSGIAGISYLQSEKILTQEELEKTDGWTDERESDVSAKDGKKFLIYGKAADLAGNTVYFASEGGEFDLKAPEIGGIESGSTYYVTQAVSVADAHLDTVTVNGEAVSEKESLLLPGNVDAAYEIRAVDQLGNETVATVTMKLISSLAEPIRGLSEDTVTSADAETIRQVLETAEGVNAGNASPAEAEELQKLIDNCRLLDERIKAAHEEYDRIADEMGGISVDTVALTDQKVLEEAKEALERLLEEYEGNYTEAERGQIETDLTRVTKSLESIRKVREAESIIAQLPDAEGVSPDNVEAEKAAEEALNSLRDLTEHEKSLVDTGRLEQLLEALAAYRIVEGDGSEWVQGETGEISFKANGAFSKFIGILIDGQSTDPGNYTAAEGSTIITLKESLLKTLVVGSHGLTVLYSDGGKASAEFKITEPDRPEATNTPEPEAINTPEPEATDTPKPEATDTPKPEATDTPKPEATNTPKPEATNTPKPEATNTPEPEATNTPEPEATNTPEPEATNTPEPTNTPKPEATNTPKPEATNTPEPEATNTPEPEATNTPEPVRTPEPEATNTPEPEATNTPKPEATNIPEPEVTNTPEPEATNTPEPEATNTPEPEATNTPEPGTTSEPIAPGTDTPAQESQKPFIKGDSGKEGWDVIRAEEEKAEAGSRINVDMNGTSVVPGDIFDTIRGRDVTVTFDMGGGICWSVDGKQILTHQAADIDFSVKPGTDTIPLEIVNRVSGERYSIQLSLAYNGEFGFTAVLSVNLGRENTGLTASLYYYNHNAGELAFVCKEKVDGDGMVSFPFTHASDYIIVIDEAGEEDSGGTVPGQPAVTAAPDVASGNAVPTKESPKTGEEEKKPACPTVAGILAGAGVAIIMAWRRKENRRK